MTDFLKDLLIQPMLGMRTEVLDKPSDDFIPLDAMSEEWRRSLPADFNCPECGSSLDADGRCSNKARHQ